MSIPTFGHPLPYREIKLASDGEILVRGKTLFQGYLNAANELELPLDEGWFRTNDLGEYSPKKGLKLLGRKDRLFISGGENIQPEEIESALITFRDITEARVVPTEDPEFGFRPVAYIASKTKFQEDELREHLSTFLPKFKIPVAFHPMDASTKNSYKP